MWHNRHLSVSTMTDVSCLWWGVTSVSCCSTFFFYCCTRHQEMCCRVMTATSSWRKAVSDNGSWGGGWRDSYKCCIKAFVWCAFNVNRRWQWQGYNIWSIVPVSGKKLQHLASNNNKKKTHKNPTLILCLWVNVRINLERRECLLRMDPEVTATTAWTSCPPKVKSQCVPAVSLPPRNQTKVNTIQEIESQRCAAVPPYATCAPGTAGSSLKS